MFEEFVQINESVVVGIGHGEELGDGRIGRNFPDPPEQRPDIVAIETPHSVSIVGVLIKEVRHGFLVPDALVRQGPLLRWLWWFLLVLAPPPQ